MTDEHDVALMTEQLLKIGRSVLAGLATPEPRFHFTVGISDYEHLLAGKWEHKSGSVDELIELAQRHGRVVLHAEAGAGKTTLAVRAFARSIEQRRPAVFIDLRRWNPLLDAQFRRMFGEDVRRMALLFEHLAQPLLDEHALRPVARAHGVLVVVDGLNEVPHGSSTALLAVLDAFATRHPQAGVIVTDRLTRRQLPSELWTTAGIAKVVPPSRVPVNAPAELPPNALLLDLFLRNQPETSTTPSAVLLEYIRNEGGLSNEELDQLARAAFGLYQSQSGRTFSLEVLASAVGDEVVERLLDADLLRTEDEYAFFRHHLFHDVLAARVAARDSGLWGDDDVLDAITFDANAFDAIALALEQLLDHEQADSFVVHIYDWNLYGAAYALARGRSLGSIAVSDGKELAILAMLAERRWDPIVATVERVEDSLRLFPPGRASRLLQARSRGEVAELVAAEPTADKHAAEWRAVFLGQVDRKRLLEFVAGRDPLLGWTAANMLRGESEDRELDDTLHGLLKHPSHKVRWRAAHVLGARPKRRNVTALLERLDHDDVKWVKYGAVRALVELAAADDGLRPRVLAKLRARVESLRGDFVVLRELERALVLRNPPRGWADAVAPLIEELWAGSDSLIDQDHWRRVGWRVTQAAAA
jgi:hypothetical protein